jgi:hypothetical protein
MQVKGNTIHARKSHIVHQYGEARWNALIERLAAQEPCFREIILPTTLISLEGYLLFQEEILREFFGDDPSAYWIMGEKSAEWAFLQGPYRSLATTKNIRHFTEHTLVSLWKTYYTAGDVVSKLEGNTYHAEIHHLPRWHLSIEYTVMGYIKRALELLGLHQVTVEKIKSVLKNDQEISYNFTFNP